MRCAACAVLTALLAFVAFSNVKADNGKKSKADLAEAREQMIGKTAPDFTPDFSVPGKAEKLSDLKGKVVVVDFWAVWCGPCVKLIPHVNELHSEFKNKGVEVIGVTSYFKQLDFDKETGRIKKLAKGDEPLTADQERDMLKNFAAHHKMDYRLMVLPENEWKETLKQYHTNGIPTVIVVDKKGNLRFTMVGGGKKDELKEVIEKCIEEK